MARKRMFDMEIVDTDLFLEMSASTQNLYFHLGMRADDDGFVSNPKKIQKIIGSNEDDLKVLIAKRFIIPFESGVIVIRHWKLNNYLRKDRYIPTIYTTEKSMLTEGENGVYEPMVDNRLTSGIPMVDNRLTSGIHSIEEKRREENRIEEDSMEGEIVSQSDTSKPYVDCQAYVDTYNMYCTKLPKVKVLTDKRKKQIKSLSAKIDLEEFKTICETTNANDFLTGNNNRGWQADFDFVIRLDKAVTILEGGYNTNKKQNTIENGFEKLQEMLREEERKMGNE